MAATLDTIAAIATAPGPAGISVIRMSGTDAPVIANRVLSYGKTGGPMEFEPQQSHRIFYGRAIDPVSGADLDEVMVAWMAAPRTFTTENVIEISCHGGPVAAPAVLRAVLAAGARAAEPGEFTLRAFLNGRLDLAEAEAVLQVVSAQSSDGMQRALEDLRGDLSARIAPARAAVLTALAYLDASADFPDDEIPTTDVAADLAAAESALADVLRGAASGRLLGDGATLALIGKPNVGKSSLLNALLRSDRAIVTPIAGTTRDVVSERAVLDGIPVTLMDTAGLTETEDVVERAGIERSRSAMERALGLILVLDGSQPLTADDAAILSIVRDRFASDALGSPPVVVACNKQDAGTAISMQDVQSRIGAGIAVVPVSALTGVGLPELEAAVAEALRAGSDPGATPSLLTGRQFAEIDRAALAIRSAREELASGFPTDVLATDVRAAARALGRITGEDIDDAVLAEIFSRFCIGK